MTTSLDVARPEIGYHESPANSNKTKYGVWYGFNGVPWCAIFLSWVMYHAGMGDRYRFASTSASIAWAKREGLWRTGVVPKPGWIAVRLWSSNTGHTGIVEYTEGGYDVTIEGNTSSSDDRNGGIVQRRKRSRSFWLGYIELPLSPGGTPPPTHPSPGAPAMHEFFAYAAAFGGGVDVAAGDIDGDGNIEIVTGPGPGGGPHVRVWRLVGGKVVELGGFFAFPSDMQLGLTVSVAPGLIIVGARAGGGPHVKVFEFPKVLG